MPTYALNISLTSEQVSLIASAGQYLTIAKSNPVTSEPPYNVAWVAFHPTQSDNISWEVDYAVYATQMLVQHGAKIVLSASQSASAGDNWPWNGTSFVSPPGSLGYASYGVQDNVHDVWQFGLAQEVTVNGVTHTSPLNIISGMYNDQIVFTPEETVYVFLSAYANNGSVISSVTNNALQVVLTSVATTANLIFNSSNDEFQIAPSGAEALEMKGKRHHALAGR